eukprot:7716803-Heterocapsa_arctica.AAC.1
MDWSFMPMSRSSTCMHRMASILPLAVLWTKLPWSKESFFHPFPSKTSQRARYQARNASRP